MEDDREVAELHKNIKEAFEASDRESKNTVGGREIGTIVRSLGCCPSEGEIHDDCGGRGGSHPLDTSDVKDLFQ